jgi:hypothetical protein
MMPVVRLYGSCFVEPGPLSDKAARPGHMLSSRGSPGDRCRAVVSCTVATDQRVLNASGLPVTAALINGPAGQNGEHDDPAPGSASTYTVICTTVTRSAYPAVISDTLRMA